MRLQDENDIEILRQKAVLLQRENDLLHFQLQALAAELDRARGQDKQALQQQLNLLEEKLKARTDALFGKSSEKMQHPGLPDKPQRAPQPGHGPTPQPKLPVVEQIHELDEADKVCNACGGGLKPMNGQFEEADEIDVVERTFRIVKHKRQKYTCKCGGCVDTALGPPKLIPGGRYSLDFAIQVALEKYLYHMPLTRQAMQMAAQGLVVNSATLWDQIEALAKHLTPSYEALRRRILQAIVVGADETRWPLLDSEGKIWWAWSVCSKYGAWYRIARSRSHQEAGNLLGDYKGIVMADAYAGYEALRKARKRDGPTFSIAHCWAHVRRKFFEIKDQPEAKKALELIGELYAVETKAAAAHEMGTAEWRQMLAELRRTESAAILQRLWIWHGQQRVLPKSGLGRALAYMGGIRPELEVFVQNVDVPLDNNDTERSMRGLAVGRKNHYGSKSLRGTEVAALFYSLVETCKRLEVEPATYLRQAALRAIAQPGAVMLPHELVDG